MHRGRVLATIYGKTKAYPFYRVSAYAAGKRRLSSFPTYSEAKTEADRLVSDLAKGSQAAALSAAQSRDALAAFERLNTFYQSTGRRVSLLAAVSVFAEASTKLGDRPMAEAIDGFLRNVVQVKRKDVLEAANEFLAAEEPRAKAGEGQRAQISSKYAYNRALMLRRFAGSFPGSAVCDLAKELLDSYLTAEAITELSAKSRNHQRATIRQFLNWCVRKDYLAPTHRLGEADAMRPERANTATIEFYTALEFRTLLEAAEGPMRAMIAIGGLAGLRTSELLRLDWADVWRVPGHVEVTKGKSKTRQRRLVEICPTLAAWLGQLRNCKSGPICALHEITWQQHFVKLCEAAKVTRKANGLRHSFCSFHFARHANENLTAQQAGNSPAMIHAHYKGLATKAEAEKWFNVRPGKTAKKVMVLPKLAAA